MMRLAAVPIAIVLAVTLSGCAGRGTASPAAGGVQSNVGGTSMLPEWVRVVHPESDGRDIYVGGCSMAAGPAESVEMAGADAFSQITERAQRDFRKLFSGAAQRSDVELTSIDRLDFRGYGFELYSEHMIEKARLDRVYFEDCETGRSHDRLPDHWAGGPVCRTFVELSLNAAAWGRMLTETILEMRHEYASGGRSNLAELADWMIASLEAPERDSNAKRGER